MLKGENKSAITYLKEAQSLQLDIEGVINEKTNQYLNELGIYDMTGNVWEWVNDYHDYYPKQDQIDPIGPLSGDKRVNRGGSCENGLELSRLTIRAGGFPYNSHKTIGFRLAKPIIK